MADHASKKTEASEVAPEEEEKVGGWEKVGIVIESAFACEETISNWQRVAVWSTAAQGDPTLTYFAMAGSIAISIPYFLNTIVAIRNKDVLYWFLNLFRLHGLTDLRESVTPEYLASYERRRNVYGTQLVEQFTLAILQIAFMFSATTRLLGPVEAINRIPKNSLDGNGWVSLVSDVVFGGYVLTSFMSTHIPTLNIIVDYLWIIDFWATLSFVASVYHRILSMEMLIFSFYWSSGSGYISAVVIWIVFLTVLFIIPLFLNINLSHYTEDEESPSDRHPLMAAMLWVYRVIVFIIVGFFSIYIVNFKTYEVVFYPPEFKPREDGHEVDVEGMKCACISVRFWGLIEIVLRLVFTYVVCFCWIYVWIPSIDPAIVTQVNFKAAIGWAQSGLIVGAVDLLGVLYVTIMYTESISCCLDDATEEQAGACLSVSLLKTDERNVNS